MTQPPLKCTKAITSFNQFDLCPQILSAIAALGFKEPTLVQQSAIPLALQGKDLATKARTGSGKTAAYLIPLLNYLIKHPDGQDSSTPCRSPRGLILVPTTELAEQVSVMVRGFCKYSKRLEHINLCGRLNVVQQLQALAQGVEIIIATPARILRLLSSLNETYLQSIKFLVVDEADLLLSFGYQEDMYKLSAKLPEVSNYQTFLASATLEPKVAQFASRLLTQPVFLDMSKAEGLHQDLTQYVIQCTQGDSEKFLLIYFILKLNLIKGKILIFVNSINRAFRVRLFLEQFGVKSVVLNSELPLNSRLHIVSEFNEGIYDILIATDERGRSAMAEHKGFLHTIESNPGGKQETGSAEKDENSEIDSDEDMKGFESTDSEDDAVDSNRAINEDSALKTTEPDVPVTTAPSKTQRKKVRRSDNEHGTSRGIDFHNVTAVINMDMPIAPQAYVHRAGRTARGGRKGMVLSFVQMDPTARVMDIKASDRINEASVFAAIESHQTQLGFPIVPFLFNKAQVAAFQYRMEDALRSVTAVAVQAARVAELKREVLRSTQLRAHFEDHAADLAFLRDRPLIPTRVQPHLKNLPAYLLPDGVREVKVSNIQFPSSKMNVRRINKRPKRAGARNGGVKHRKLDPLKRLKL